MPGFLSLSAALPGCREAHSVFIAPPGRVTASRPLRMQLNTTPCMKVTRLATAIITGDIRSSRPTVPPVQRHPQTTAVKRSGTFMKTVS